MKEETIKAHAMQMPPAAGNHVLNVLLGLHGIELKNQLLQCRTREQVNEWVATKHFQNIGNNMDKLQKIEEALKKERPVRLPGLKRKREESLEEFLVTFFAKWNDSKDTIYADGPKAKSKDNHEVQTEAGRRRSIGDVYSICRYYYPGTTLKQVKDILYGPLFKKVPHFRSSICHVINKRVFYRGEDKQESQIYDTNVNDEYGMKVANWKTLKEV